MLEPSVYIRAVGTQFPKQSYQQEEITTRLIPYWQKSGLNIRRFIAIHENMGVSQRHLILPIDAYESLGGMSHRNQLWQEHALILMEQALAKTMQLAEAPWEDIGLIATSSVTGIAVPSLEARLINRLPLPKTCRRLPIFGLGCLAGVAGLNRTADYLRAYPEKLALFVTTELCSLTWHPDDYSMANIVGTGLFADGCGAVLLVGEKHPLASSCRLRWREGYSHFFPDTERVMGFDLDDSGFKLVLSGEVPAIVKEMIPGVLESFLKAQMLAQSDLDFFVLHPGGPKVISAFAEALGIDIAKLQLSIDSLAAYGNLSSVSVLTILERVLLEPPAAGKLGLMAALGPGFCTEMALLEARVS